MYCIPGSYWKCSKSVEMLWYLLLHQFPSWSWCMQFCDLTFHWFFFSADKWKMGVFSGCCIALELGATVPYKKKQEIRRLITENDGIVSFILTKKVTVSFQYSLSPESIQSEISISHIHWKPEKRAEVVKSLQSTLVLITQSSSIISCDKEWLTWKRNAVLSLWDDHAQFYKQFHHLLYGISNCIALFDLVALHWSINDVLLFTWPTNIVQSSECLINNVLSPRLKSLKES